MRVGAGHRLAGQRGAHHIADADDRRPVFLADLHGGERVGGLTRLRDGDQHVVLAYDGVAVAEFRRVFHLHGDAHERFEQVFRH